MQMLWAKCSDSPEWLQWERSIWPVSCSAVGRSFSYLFHLYWWYLWRVTGDTQIWAPCLFFQIHLTSSQRSTLLYQLMQDIMRDATITNHLPFLLCMCEYSVFPPRFSFLRYLEEWASIWIFAMLKTVHPEHFASLAEEWDLLLEGIKVICPWSKTRLVPEKFFSNRWLANVTYTFCWHLFWVLSFYKC